MTRAFIALLATLTLSACGGGGRGTATGEVSGRVVDDQHRPLVGVTVVIQDVTTTTDVEGRFSIPDVTRPYTAVLADANGAAVFVGLTRSDPTLEVQLGSSGSTIQATLDGIVSGGAGFPQPANHKTLALLTSETSFSGAIGNTLLGADDDYSLSMSWHGAPTAQAHIHALQFALDPITGIPTSYTGYGETSLTVSAGAFVNLTTVLSPIPTNMFSGAISLPAGFTAAAQLRMRRGRQVFSTIVQDSPAPLVFAYPIPGVSSLTADLRVFANGPTGTSYAAIRSPSSGSANHVASLPIPANITAPPPGTTGVDHTVEFSATPHAQRVYAFRFRPNTSGMNLGSGPSLVVFTTSPTTTIPDLSAYGLALPSDEPYRVSVRTISPFSSLDAATGAGGLSFAHPGGVGYETDHSPSEFQTAP